MSPGDRVGIELQPIVGYAIHYLSLGESDEHVRARLERNPDFGVLSEHTIDRALRDAHASERILSQIQRQRGNVKIGTILRGQNEPSTNLGVRVEAIGHDAYGNLRVVKLTINVGTEATRAQILQRVQEHVKDATQNRPGSDTAGFTVDVNLSSIYRVQIGGFTRPSIQW